MNEPPHDHSALADDWPFPLFKLSGLKTDIKMGGIIWANQAAQEWLGTSIRHLRGKSIASILDVDESTADIITRCQSAQAPITRRDCPLKRAQHEEQLCNLTAFPNEDNIGLSVQPAFVQKDEAKSGGQVVSGLGRMIAHELKNPLAGIKGAA